jgi:DNA-binding winged helix-turn-helix (wHTH) protein/TolB-like protein/tetratricopeptide (TPR) repeat protein
LINEPEKPVYRFDGFVVDAQNFVVERGDQPVSLTPRAFDVLLLLLKNRGQVVEKRQMFDEIWKDTFVSDNALTKVIKELRQSLGDSVDEPKFIETIPKRGYRFIATLNGAEAPVDERSPVETTNERPWRTTVSIVGMSVLLVLAVAAIWAVIARRSAETASAPKTIAVLPFKPLNAESRDESLEMGMAETLITRLTSLRDVVVRPIGSVRKFTDANADPISAGEQLQTDTVVDGSIQKAGERVRVTVRLFDVRTRSTLWSEQFDENFTDIFRLQDSITQRIAGALALKLSRHEQEQLAKHMTENPRAYEAYLRGQFHWHRRGPEWIDQSLRAYKQALEEDPNFALAHIGVADAYIMMSGHRRISMQEAEAKAAPSITRALEIDNDLADAHNALAELKYQYQYDWRGAEIEFKKAVDLNPNATWIRQAYGWFLMCDGQFDAAALQMDMARQLDPSSLTLTIARGRLYYFSRQYDQAIEYFRRVLELEPNDRSAHTALMAAYERTGRHPEAMEEFFKLTGMDEEHAADQEEFRRAFAEGGWTGFLRKNLEKLDKMRPRNRASDWTYAELYIRLGDREKAFESLEKVFNAHDVAILQFKVEPANDVLRGDPRYAKLLAKIGQVP